MNEINIYLADLVVEGRLSSPEAENFLDHAYDLCLDGIDDEKIESEVIEMVEAHLENNIENCSQ